MWHGREGKDSESILNGGDILDADMENQKQTILKSAEKSIPRQKQYS
jgi:hypothetical protein